MLDMPHEDIERLWSSLSNYVPDKHKADAAIDFVKTLDDLGVEEDEIKASGEYDPKLEDAISTYYEDREGEEEQYDDRYED